MLQYVSISGSEPVPLTTTKDFSACPNKNGLSFRRAVFVEMRQDSRNSLKDQRGAGSSCFHPGVLSLSVFHADGSEIIPALSPVSRSEQQALPQSVRRYLAVFLADLDSNGFAAFQFGGQQGRARSGEWVEDGFGV